MEQQKESYRLSLAFTASERVRARTVFAFLPSRTKCNNRQQEQAAGQASQAMPEERQAARHAAASSESTGLRQRPTNQAKRGWGGGSQPRRAPPLPPPLFALTISMPCSVTPISFHPSPVSSLLAERGDIKQQNKQAYKTSETFL